MEVLRIQKQGNSQGIRLSKKLLKDLGIDINDKIEITLNGEEIILKKVKKYANLDDLFKDYKEDYRKDFDEFEFLGEAQGREFKWQKEEILL